MNVFTEVHAHTAFAPDKMRKNNLFTTPRLFCDVYCFEPGQEQSSHSHAGSDKVYYVIEGSGRICVGTEERQVSAGAAVLAPAGLAHSVHNPGPDRLTLLVIMAPKP